MRKSAIAAAIVAASLLPASAASAQTATPPMPSPGPAVHPIRPAEFFDGLVNDAARESTIRMACPSVIRPGQTGHPVPGQSVSVHQLFPPSPIATGLGFTGKASTISATLRVISPAATTTAPAPIALAVFSVYDRPVAIPTTLTLPCGGAGAVVFDPVQGGNTADSFTTKVKFVSITPVSD
jgi:hypothetical protein